MNDSAYAHYRGSKVTDNFVVDSAEGWDSCPASGVWERRVRGVFFLLLLLVAVTGGCAYFKARVHDFADMFSIEFTFGPGFMVWTQATYICSFGGGYITGTRFVLWGLSAKKVKASEVCFSLPPIGGGHGFAAFKPPLSDAVVWHFAAPKQIFPDRAQNRLVPPWYRYASEWESRWGLYHWRFYTYDLLDIRVAVHLGYFGFAFAFKPVELLDFLVGLVGVDLVGDDRRKFSLRPPELQP